jgi:transcriptional regulator with XRE-family HTH domain
MAAIHSDDHPTWGQGVKVLRGIYGLNQAELAKLAGCAQATISELERDRRNISEALRVRIARALHVDPHDLFPYREHNGDGDSNGNGNAA